MFYVKNDAKDFLGPLSKLDSLALGGLTVLCQKYVAEGSKIRCLSM